MADEEDFYPEADLPKANIVRRGKAPLIHIIEIRGTQIHRMMSVKS